MLVVTLVSIETAAGTTRAFHLRAATTLIPVVGVLRGCITQGQLDGILLAGHMKTLGCKQIFTKSFDMTMDPMSSRGGGKHEASDLVWRRSLLCGFEELSQLDT